MNTLTHRFYVYNYIIAEFFFLRILYLKETFFWQTIYMTLNYMAYVCISLKILTMNFIHINIFCTNFKRYYILPLNSKINVDFTIENFYWVNEKETKSVFFKSSPLVLLYPCSLIVLNMYPNLYLVVIILVFIISLLLEWT